MKIKNDNKQEISAWLRANSVTRLKPGKARGATTHGSICAGSFSASLMSQSQARMNWYRNEKEDEKTKKLKKAKLKKAAWRKKLFEARSHEQAVAKKKKQAFKVRRLHAILNAEMNAALDRDKS